MQAMFSDSSVEIMSAEENEGQERWQPWGSSKAPNQASEARSGIRQRKIPQKSRIGRPKHQTSPLDVSEQVQTLMRALEAAQTDKPRQQQPDP